MKTLFICLSFFFFINLFADETNDPYLLAITTAEPSTLVGGCVNAITGDYVISKNDITAQGVEPITVNQTYISKNRTLNWKSFNHLEITKKY